MSLRVLTVVGARPQFIKAATVSRAIRDADGIEEILVHTGQHFDINMSDVFFADLDIPKPDYCLDIHGGHHGEMTGRMLAGLESLMLKERPDWVLVYGDTNSTLAGALAAVKLHIAVAHVEAGMRSFNRRMPEEVNRVLTDHVSSLLFCSTLSVIENLRKEGIVRGVHHVGDVMLDATLVAMKASTASRILDKLQVKSGCYSVATVHRAENTDDPGRLADIFEFLRKQALDCPIVLPLHPRTRSAVKRHAISAEGLVICDPLGYLDMVRLLRDCRSVLTDSGGLQKEAYFHRKPCVTMRSETEWVETIECGWNRLWHSDGYAPRKDIPDFGSGDAASRIVKRLLS